MSVSGSLHAKIVSVSVIKQDPRLSSKNEDSVVFFTVAKKNTLLRNTKQTPNNFVS